MIVVMQSVRLQARPQHRKRPAQTARLPRRLHSAHLLVSHGAQRELPAVGSLAERAVSTRAARQDIAAPKLGLPHGSGTPVDMLKK